MVDQKGGGMKNSCNINMTFNADDVEAALEAARRGGLLCATCMQKIATLEEMSQSDFCPQCQEAVTSQLSVVAEGRLVEALIRMGLPADSVQISND